MCWAECEPVAIDFSLPDTELTESFNEVVIAKGQLNAFNKPAGDLGYGTYPKVISDLQFERRLPSPSLFPLTENVQ